MESKINLNKNVLVIDDERSLLIAVKYSLEETGCKVTICDNGENAISEMKNKDFDIVFLDIRMPYQNGVETLEEIKKIDKETPIVMIAANSTDTLIPDATRLGANEFLFKPFDTEDLVKIINRVSK